MIILDTTVLVYATGADHPMREPARAVIAAITNGDLQATTTIEVIQEFAYVRARRTTRDDAAELAGHFATLLAPVLSVARSELDSGLGLWCATPTLGSFDAVLAACAIAHGAMLVSGDHGFADVPGLAHVTLDDRTIPQLTAR